MTQEEATSIVGRSEIQEALRVLDLDPGRVPTMEDIRPGMSAEQIARVIKAIRVAGGVYAEPDNVPTATTEEDRKIQAIMTRDFRLEPMTVDEQRSLAAAAGAALKAAKQ